MNYAEGRCDCYFCVNSHRDTAPTGYHGEGGFDLHYDPWCPRCTEQRDRLRPPIEMDEVYAIVAEETT